MPEPRPTIKAGRAASYRRPESPAADLAEAMRSNRPGLNRSTTFEGPTQLRRDISPVAPPRLSRIPSDSLTIRNASRSHLNPVNATSENNIFSDQDDSTFYSNSSPDRAWDDRSASPATSHGSSANLSNASSTMPNGKKGPPPPPSRAKKPPPPPPPPKRSLLV